MKIIKFNIITGGRFATFSEIGRAVKEKCGSLKVGDSCVIKFLGSGRFDPLDLITEIIINKKNK